LEVIVRLAIEEPSGVVVARLLPRSVKDGLGDEGDIGDTSVWIDLDKRAR
jgi:hypothetical protein